MISHSSNQSLSLIGLKGWVSRFSKVDPCYVRSEMKIKQLLRANMPLNEVRQD